MKPWSSRLSNLWWCAFFISVWPQWLAAQIVFTENGAARGIYTYTAPMGMGAGVAAADFDNDGDIDIFVPNGGGVADQLYVNQGNGQFLESAATVGLDSMENHRVPLWFDYDGDQDLDLLVAGDCLASIVNSPHPCTGTTTFRLYRQDATGLFTDVTQSANLENLILTMSDQQLGGLAAGDINNDGFLDLFLSTWRGTERLFLNNGDGTFADISASAGIDIFGFFFQPIMSDFDGDGWLDIYVPWDAGGNLLFLNQHDNTFIDVAGAAGVANPWNGMGACLGDYDNDNDLDLYVANIYKPVLLEEIYWHNNLFRNDSAGSVLSLSYTDVSEWLGIHNCDWSWGTTFLDGDNDGWLDLAVTNGFDVAGYDIDPSRFFMNSGGSPVSFTDVSNSVQFNDTYWGSSLIAFDVDRDGDLDLMQTTNSGIPPRLLENLQSGPAAANHYLVVQPRMNGTNHYAVGAVVHVTTGGLSMMRQISAGTSYLGQEPAEAFFGLGSATTVDSVVVQWPDGTQTTRSNVSVDQIMTICPTSPLLSVDLFISTILGNLSDPFHTCMTDLNLDGTVNGEDIALYIDQSLAPF